MTLASDTTFPCHFSWVTASRFPEPHRAQSGLGSRLKGNVTARSCASSRFLVQECLGLVLVKCYHVCYGEKQILEILLVASLRLLQTPCTFYVLVKHEPRPALNHGVLRYLLL